MSIPRLSRTEALILELLAGQPEGMYGLQMVRACEQLKRGTVYVTLGRMAEKKYVSSELQDRGGEGGLGRRVFKVSGYGVRVWQAHRAWQQAAEGLSGEEALAT